ncbi:MAG: alpha/beta hydrolase family protein, partial [Candidatus Binatia bacterium]
AYAYLWRHGDRGRKTIVCIHGYRGGFVAIDGRAFEIHRLFLEAGLDVALAILPYHGPRTPFGSVSGQPFLNDPRRTLEAVAQGAHDLRILVSWLRHEGAASVGVAGFSLGGYMTALLASVEPELAFAAPIIPVASFADLLWERAGRRGEHEAARAAGMSLELFRKLFAPHCPLDHRPQVERERRLVIAGEGDRIAPPGHARALAAHWRTEVEWFPGGHLAQLGRRAALAKLRELAAAS